jgi:hypothetical protein
LGPSILGDPKIIDTSRWESDNFGWMPCDGRKLLKANYKPLLDKIGLAWGEDDLRAYFFIPNLQGYFLRGADHRSDQPVDPERDARTLPPGQKVGGKGRSVGSFQSFATALPVKEAAAAFPYLQDPATEFRTTTTGVHSHALPFEIDATREVDPDKNPNTVAYPGSGKRTASEGDHHHEVLGGNLETRPVNAYVHWIIRWL